MSDTPNVLQNKKAPAAPPDRYLRPIFEQLFGETHLLDCSREDLIRMEQASVYLLKIGGFPLEKYPFRWLAEFGPASRMLTYDCAWGQNIPIRSIVFRKEFQTIIYRLRAAIERLNTETYSVADWLQCMAAIHYLRTYIMKWNPTVDEVIDETCRRLPRFKDRAFVADAEKQLNTLLPDFSQIKNEKEKRHD